VCAEIAARFLTGPESTGRGPSAGTRAAAAGRRCTGPNPDASRHSA
jgi:hypothetical protein